MAKKKKRNYKIKAFVALRWDILKHKAYIALPPNAKGMLPYFLGKVRIPFTDPSYYFAEFSFTYTEAEKYGCTRRTFYRVIGNLMGHGFIDPIRKGGRNGGRDTASVFRLSKRWARYGTAVFEPISWASFGENQIRRQVQNWHCPVAKNTPEEERMLNDVCQN